MTRQPDSPTETSVSLDLTRWLAESYRQRNLTRRAEALLAAAGVNAPVRAWFVVAVEPQMDARVAEILALAGVEAWLPSVTMKPRRRGAAGKSARVPSMRLAVPGYVFAKVAASVQSWSGLSAINGVSAILGAAGRPVAVADKSVDLFKAFLADDPEAIATITNAIRRGDAVHVGDGPFRALSGKVDRLNCDTGRAIVEILLFGRLTPVHLDIAQLSKL